MLDSSALSVLFRTIYRRERGFTLQTIRKLGVPSEQVEDAAQEVFMVLHARLAQLEPGETLRPWLRSVVLRVCLNRRRLHYRRSLRLCASGPCVDPDSVRCERRMPDESLERSEALRSFERALQRLPGEQRDVFLLARLEQRTLAEIGAILRISPNTAASRLRAASAHLERACRVGRGRRGPRESAASAARFVDLCKRPRRLALATPFEPAEAAAMRPSAAPDLDSRRCL